MASLRNAVKRITHKERSQPQSRSHLGILEKKKDYKKRADNYHRKEDRIHSMERKASMRNPDEFYFGMKNSQIDQGGHHRKTQESIQKELQHIIGPDAVRIMKEQDLAYVRMQKQRDQSKVDKLRSSLHYLGTGTTEGDVDHGKSHKKGTNGKHTIFVNTKKDADDFDIAKHFDTLPEFVDRSFNRPRVSSIRAAAGLNQRGDQDDRDDGNDHNLAHHFDDEEEDEYTKTKEDLQWEARNARKIARKLARLKSSAYGEMEARRKRVEAMELAESHLVMEKNCAGKGRKRKIAASEDGKPAQYKWRRKRKS